MYNKKIIIAGGAGFIGQGLCQYFDPSNELIILTRDRSRLGERKGNIRYTWWDGRSVGKWINEFEHADLLINLAGQSVNCRYTPANKQRIFDSRTASTAILGTAVRACRFPPRVWINAGSATIYRDAMDRPQDELTGEVQNDFSVQVCQAWEKAFNDIYLPATRKVVLRIAVTLGNGSVMTPYCNLLKFGLGGRQGSGHQKYSWVHMEDLARMIAFAFENKDIQGTYNCTSPNPTDNETFMQTLRNATGNHIGLPAPEWLLRIGARLIGTEPELVLKSRWVLPTRMLQAGFTFKHPQLQEALRDVVQQLPRRQYHLF